MKLHEAIGLELERREMEITFEFACRDDCLGKMVPSDLRQELPPTTAALAALLQGEKG